MVNLFNNKWILWYHDIDEKDWSINGYKKIGEIDSIESFTNLYKSLDEIIVQNSMLFLMREDITPIWEDKQNINGGCWSFKISKKDIFNAWKELSLHLVSENITKDIKNSLNLNGISISPKKNFSIAKIWNKDNKINNNSILSKKIPNIFIYDSIYKSHQ